MLTSKDLMIGDWYVFQGHPYKCTASDIASLAECKEKGAPTDISEIPLTAEILEKNGWKYSHIIKSYELKYNAFYISINLEEKTRIYVMNDYIFGAALGFIHELQNALRLFGIEKEITI